MSLSFINQSIVNPRIVPTAAEKQFLLSKTGFLDREGTKRVHGKDALAMLSHSKLPIDKIKKIWLIANQKNNEYLSYEDMYVAFRLISYAQNGIELSKDNVEANIKCPLPVFADSDDQEDHRDRNISIPPLVRATSISNRYFSKKQIEAFEDIWMGASKNQYFISGSDVKKKFQSQGEKGELSKIWKLCCRTTKGSLTKGECFVFVQILRMTGEGVSLPDSLAPEMLAAISQIDTPIKNNPSLLPKSVLVDRSNSSNKYLKIQSKIKQSQQPINQMKMQLSAIHSQEGKFSNALKEFEEYVIVCERNTSFLTEEIEKIKTVQADSINRLNLDLNRMKEVIEKQNNMIYELTANLKNKTGDPRSMPEKRQLGPPIQNDAPSRFSAKSLESEGSSRNDLYPYQLQTIKVWHAVHPIDPEQLPEIQKKIFSMNVSELKSCYEDLLKKYHEQQNGIEHDENEQQVHYEEPQKQYQPPYQPPHQPAHQHQHQYQEEHLNITVTQPQNDNSGNDHTYVVKDESMFVKKNSEALEAIENIFGNLNLDESNTEYKPNKEDFFD